MNFENNKTHKYELALTLDWKYIPEMMQATKIIIEKHLEKASQIEVKIDGMHKEGLEGIIIPTIELSKKNTFNKYQNDAVEVASSNKIIQPLIYALNSISVKQEITAKEQTGNSKLNLTLKQNLNDKNFNTYIIDIKLTCRGKHQALGSDLFNYFITKRTEIKSNDKINTPILMKYYTK